MIHTTQFQHEVIMDRNPLKKLMVVLHGRGDSLRPFREFDEELKIPGMNYLLLNAPRRYDTGFTWYGFPPNQGPGVRKARKKLFLMIEELEKQGWRSENLFFLGFSQGSLVCTDLILNLPKPLGGVIGISGYVYFFSGWKNRISPYAFKTPWVMTHGTRDDALEIEETRRDVAKLRSAGLKPLWKEFDKDHEIEEKHEIPFLRKWVIDRI